MGSDSVDKYFKEWKQLESYNNIIPQDLIFSLRQYIYQSYKQNKYSKPMPWIGMYIASASLICILAMVADLLHGSRNRQLWFPCKYFTLNAASLTVIAVAMKLPMDLNNPMPGHVDQVAKLGSMAFMCNIMANLLPSLATMNRKELVTNMIALGVLVITLVVNICIQIKTGLVSRYYTEIYSDFDIRSSTYFTASTAVVYVCMLLMLLMIHTCSSLAILKSKEMLESKYRQVYETALKDQPPGRLSVEKLKQHVTNYSIMAGTSSPQFVTASFATTSASGVICALSTLSLVVIMIWTIETIWSGPEVCLRGQQSWLGRCFASLSFKLSSKWSWNHIKVFKVESYWTQELSDWKQSNVTYPFRSRKCKVIIQKLKILFLNFFIGFQKTVVVACKMLALISIFFLMCALCCSRSWKWLKAMLSASGIVLGKKAEQLDKNKDLHQYALLLEDDMEFSEKTLKRISKSVNRLIQRAEKQQPNNLLKLLAESNGFDGVGKYDSHHVPPLLSTEYIDYWSLPLVTLTAIAISLPNIGNIIIDRLLSSVSEGLVYVKLVEESLNATDDYVSTRMAAKMVWQEVEVYHKWLGHRLRKLAPQLNTSRQILQWFSDTAKRMVAEVGSQDIRYQDNNSICSCISANSMYRITETILLSYHNNANQVSQEELFVQLSSMIADILSACLTNLPRVIMMKCHTIEIEKREASVHVAAQLLGETMQIINSLEDCELPSLNPQELAFIDKWHSYLKHPFP